MKLDALGRGFNGKERRCRQTTPLISLEKKKRQEIGCLRGPIGYGWILLEQERFEVLRCEDKGAEERQR